MYAGPSDQVCELLPSTEEKGQSRRAQPSMILCSGSGDLPSKSLTAHAHHTLIESGTRECQNGQSRVVSFPFLCKDSVQSSGGSLGRNCRAPITSFQEGYTHTYMCRYTTYIHTYTSHTHRINTHTLHIHTSTHHTCTCKHTTYICMYTTYIHMLLTHTIQTCISHKYIDQHTTHVYKHMPHTTHIHIHTYRNTA